MTDRELLLERLERLAIVLDELMPQCAELVRDAIALLKEQQKLVDDTPHWVFGNSYGHAWMKCSNCCVSQSGQTSCWSYCPNCGTKMEGQVKWDE